MKRLLTIVVLFVFCYYGMMAQSSLPGNIIFTTQSQIDSFISENPEKTFIEGDVVIDGHLIENLKGLTTIAGIGGSLRIGSEDNIINFIPDLTGLDNLSSIGGDLEIINNGTLGSLTGLQGLVSIGGSLRMENNLPLSDISAFWNLRSVGGDIIIRKNQSLASLSGLEGLSEVTGMMVIRDNAALMNLHGLEGISSIRGSVKIISNEKLLSLSGLDNLTIIEDTLLISGNRALADMTGLGSLAAIHGGLWIGGIYGGNDFLSCLDGLDNLTHAGNFLKIENNKTLASLSGLDSLDPGSLRGLYIWNNPMLSSCEVKGIADFLSNPGGKVEIYQNAEGCNSPAQVARSSGFDMPCLPYGTYSFYSQRDIDNFPENYPGCTDLSGDVIISGKDITDLQGLSQISSIQGNLIVFDNDLLSSLAGLEKLSHISKGLYIGENDILPDLQGLCGLQHIEQFLEIDFNGGMSSLKGLDQLTYAGNMIHIEGNCALVSLQGLDNIDVALLDHLIITNNFKLSSCAISGICDCLSLSTCQISLFNNGKGCMDPHQVASLCDPSQTELIPMTDQCSYSVNKETGEVIFSFNLDYSMDVSLLVYNQTGRISSTLVSERMESGSHEITWFPDEIYGVYYYSLTAGRSSSAGELVVSR